jgi:hypothetical protein
MEMKEMKQRGDIIAPEVTDEQLAELRGRLAVARREPLLPAGSVSKCPNCGGRMVTTNELEQMVPTPGLVYIIARLPGARCIDCESTELDGMAVAILENIAPRGIVADYESTVTHSSGSTLGTYFKRDLARVMELTGDEHLLWKVVDRDKALVQVERKKEWTHGATTRTHRSRGRTTSSTAALRSGRNRRDQDDE